MDQNFWQEVYMLCQEIGDWDGVFATIPHIERHSRQTSNSDQQVLTVPCEPGYWIDYLLCLGWRVAFMVNDTTVMEFGEYQITIRPA